MNGSKEFSSLCREPWASDPFTSVNIGGISLSIFGLHQLNIGRSVPCRVIFCLHGRSSDRTEMDTMCRSFCSAPRPNQLPIVSISLDQRNHGSRLLDQLANTGWSSSSTKKGNPHHAIDMYSLQHGTAMDISFLIDHLPHYLNLTAPVQVQSWGVAGISLGGHAALIAVMNDHRLDLAVSILGCGDYETLIKGRFDGFKSRHPDTTLGTWSEIYPPSLAALVNRVDPVHQVKSIFEHSNRKELPSILIVGGGQDKLVPVTANQQYWTKMENLYSEKYHADRLVHWVDKEAKHECTLGMAQKVVAWLQGI